jgi:drug/metabolite transporter (DMT)-like permease
MIVGVASGFVAAFFQSSSYIFTRRYVAAFRQSSLGLLISGHCIMGLFSAILLPFFFPKTMPPVSQFDLPLFLYLFFYFGGQISLLFALKNVDASRVSPLLGLKIIVLAFIGVVFLKQPFHHLQWLSMCLSVVAACMLGFSGKKISFASFMWIVLACISYSLSDIFVRQMMCVFLYCGLFKASIITTCIGYTLCGLLACVVLIIYPVKQKVQWKFAFPFAFCWYTGMIFLFVCFTSIGVVFGNIIQSTRGLASIVMGSYIAQRGYGHIEEKVEKKVFLIRLSAGVLMVAAIALFYAGNYK